MTKPYCPRAHVSEPCYETPTTVPKASASTRAPDRLPTGDDDVRPRDEAEARRRWAAEGALIGEPKFTALIREQLAAAEDEKAFERDALKSAQAFLAQEAAEKAAAEAAKRGTEESRKAYREALAARMAILMGPSMISARAARELSAVCDARAALDSAEHWDKCACRWCRSEEP